MPIPRVQSVVLVLLLILVTLGAIPHYLAGQVSGAVVPPVKVLPALQTLRENGLAVPGWQTDRQQTVTIEDRQWSQQILTHLTPPPPNPNPELRTPNPELNTALLLLMPQKHGHDRPQVEWTDLQGTQDWTEDSEQHPRISFANPAHPGQKVTITPRFLRGWHKLEDGTIVTSAVLEWYVWPQGGHWSPNPWFWQDWLAQWRSQRLPWIAVAILIPLEPLGQAETAWPVLEPLAEIVQQELDALLVAH